MKNFEDTIRKFLEEISNQPFNKKEIRSFLKFFFESLFESLHKEKKFTFPKGFGSLRIKQLKPFKITKKDGTVVVIRDKRIIRYFSGHSVKRRLQDGR